MMSGPMNILRIAVATILVTACVSDAESLFKSGLFSSPQGVLIPEQKPYGSDKGDGVKRQKHASYRDKPQTVSLDLAVYNILHNTGGISSHQGERASQQTSYGSDGDVGVTSEKNYSYREESTNGSLDMAVSNLLLYAGRINSQQGEFAPEGRLSESDEGDKNTSEKQASNKPPYTSFDLVSYLRQNSKIEESFVVPIDHNISPWFVCKIMKRIAAIFRNRLPPAAGTQFAVLAIVPDSVQDPSEIDSFLAPQHSNINYRFTTPTKFPNQRCRTHAEIIAMQGAPHEGFNLAHFYNNFIDANPGDAPRFAVLYTWVFPCRACADQIAANFGGGYNPQWPIPTFVGRTTRGDRVRPPLTDQHRAQIENILVLALIQLFHITQDITVLVPKLDNETKTNTMFAGSEDDLCNSCYLSSKGLDNKFNCEDTGPSSPDSCPTDVALNSVQIYQLDKNNGTVTMKADEPCCKPGPTELYRAAKGQKCKTISPCGYSGENYVWCNLTDGGWEYCCTGECGNHGNTGYDWCTSGSKWQKCHRDPARLDRTATLDLCRSDHKCGFHGEDYTWCFKQSGSWDYCCTSNCEQYGAEYDWCSAGSKWEYCKRDLPREYSSALLKQCKSTSPCEYDGYDYAWCYTNDGSWDYCCTGDCGPHGYSYDWCTSGKKWSACKMQTISSARYTYNLKTCDSSGICGYNGYDYAWCYTTDGSWDYCCTETCGLNGEMYDWCTTGTGGYWQYCKREELPKSGITVTGESCRSDHSCGYYGYDYSWCYTASNWDYCCSSTCAKYNTDSNFCAAGKTHAACCCSEY